MATRTRFLHGTQPGAGGKTENTIGVRCRCGVRNWWPENAKHSTGRCMVCWADLRLPADMVEGRTR